VLGLQDKGQALLAGGGEESVESVFQSQVH